MAKQTRKFSHNCPVTAERTLAIWHPSVMASSASSAAAILFTRTARAKFKHALKRLQYLCWRLLNFLSFGLIRLPAGSYLSEYYIAAAASSTSSLAAATASGFSSSSGCLTSNSSDSDSEMSSATTAPATAVRTRRRSPRTSASTSDLSSTDTTASVAVEAVAHSYEDITRPDYHNYLWLSSRWDRTDLLGAAYFIPNWVEALRKEVTVEGGLNGGLNDYAIESSTEPASEASTEHAPVTEHVQSTEPATAACTTSKWNPWKRSSQSKHCKSFIAFYRRLSTLPDSFFPRRRIVLPKKQKTLVLDLDETLIHSTAASCAGFDFMIEVLISRTSCLYYVYKRPHLDYFLEVVSNWFNLVIYTASLKEYADPVIDLLDDGRKLFKKRLFRSSCLTTTTAPFAYLKDLGLVEGGDLSKVALIDNSAASFALYPDNAIPIESWREGKTDQGLLDLLPFLDALRFVEDVRSVLSLRRLSLYSNK